MLHIVTDGAADIPANWEKQFMIQVIPINVHFGEQTYLQFKDFDHDGFYKLIEEKKIVPKTSQPSPHQFMEFYKKIAKKGDTILSIHVTSKLSGTYASAVAAAKELAGEFNIIPVDSAGGSMGLGFMCRFARQMTEAGKSVEEIVQYLEDVRSKVQVILTLDTLEYARKSGRVGAMSAALASILNVKPIARLKDGIVEMVDKVRTRKASLQRILQMAKEAYGNAPLYVGVLHAQDLEAGMALKEQVDQIFNVKESFITDLSVSLAVNFGPGTLGIVLYPAE